jgi:hypothetical protein
MKRVAGKTDLILMQKQEVSTLYLINLLEAITLNQKDPLGLYIIQVQIFAQKILELCLITESLKRLSREEISLWRHKSSFKAVCSSQMRLSAMSIRLLAN